MTGFSGGWFQRRKARKDAAERLYESVMKAALKPDWYESLGAHDTFEGRAQMVTLLTSLACGRLAQIGGANAGWLADALNKHVLDGFDAAYREQGVGDSSIARKVRKLAEAHSGLGRATFTALAADSTLEMTVALQDVVARNGVTEDDRAAELAAHLSALDRYLKSQADDQVLSGRINWAL